MKKLILYLISLFITLVILTSVYLSIIGHETDKLNSLLENEIKSNISNTEINLNKIKIKIDIKNLSFFATTLKPEIRYYNNKVKIKKIDAYIDLKSLFVGKPKINKINISSSEVEVNEIKRIIKFQKPSNFKKFFLNNVNKGEITLKVDLDFKNNKISNYEINGVVKNLFLSFQNFNLQKSSFIYLINRKSVEINNIRGFINGFQVNSGNIIVDNSKKLNIKGDLNSDFNLSQKDINQIVKNKTLKNLKKIELNGKAKGFFDIKFDETLKVVDYKINTNGSIKNSNIEFQKPKKILFINEKINKISFEKINLKANYEKSKKKSVNFSGLYKTNNNQLQKFNLNNSFDSNSKEISFIGSLNNEIIIPIINFKSKNKISNVDSLIEFNNENLHFKKFNLEDGKNKITINDLIIRNDKLLKFENILVKTFSNNKLNNNFIINFNKKIKIKGTKYDASNLTKLLDQNASSNFLNNLSKEITLNIDEIYTNKVDVISNFSLIGKIVRGQFNKIISKGEFRDGKYLDISLKADKISKKKILEVYSDLPRSLLSNYKFFNGLIGGQLLLTSEYDAQISNTNLIIENFKVKDAPGLVKLLSLADFGGMVDAISGEGLSFERLEMSIDKTEQILNLKELYAIGPSVSILMEGYVDSRTGLVSLRGTMVPAKTLNKFLSKLPLVGDILIPKDIGEGLFGISFKMKGMPDEIKTTVNPIKTLTPRFIQKALKKSK